MAATLAYLPARQKIFVNKFSQFVMHESSELNETESNKELSDWGKDEFIFLNQLLQSEDKVDKRFIDLFKLEMAFKGEVIKDEDESED